MLAKWHPEKYELLHFIAVFFIEIYGLNNQEHQLLDVLKFLKAIKVVENVLKAFLKAMTYYQMTNYHAIDDGDDSLNGTFHLLPHENILTIALINIHYLYIIRRS